MIKIIVLLFIFINNAYGQAELVTPEVRNKLIQSGVSLDQINQAIDLLDNSNVESDGTGISGTINDANELESIKEEIEKKNDSDKSIIDATKKEDEQKSIEENTKGENDSDNSDLEELDENIDQEDENDKEDGDTNDEEDINEVVSISSNYFGYNTFLGDPEFFQQSYTESIDPDYLIGPGDEIIIMLWGDTQFNTKYNVSIEGYLFLKDVGQIFVNGLTLEKLEKKLFNVFRKSYSSLDPNSGNPSTFFDVSLGSIALRPLRIFVAGQVKQPGAYSLKNTATLFSSLYYFNGPEISGSLRSINLIRNGKQHSEIDYYDYLLTGKQVDDVKLQKDDVVFIPPRGKTVTVVGTIRRNSIFELKSNETLTDLIEIAGGLLSTTYTKRIQIDRILPWKSRAVNGIDR